MSELEVPQFEPWPKIPRWRRSLVVTEKIDGTNAQVHVLEDGRVLAGSRTRYVTPESDNYGFAGWVKENEDALRKLGPGRHYGEWWGRGINRGYGLQERRFSLFNVARWNLGHLDALGLSGLVHMVPVLELDGQLSSVEEWVENLRQFGSLAAAGYMRPEGVVIYHTASRQMFKRLLENDDVPKGAQEESQ